MNHNNESPLYYEGKPLLEEKIVVLASGVERSYPPYLIEELRNTAEKYGISISYQEGRKLFEIHESGLSEKYRNLLLASAPVSFMNHYEQKEYFDPIQAEMTVQKT
ncbi:MAG: hypothetical protein IKI37_02410, partial [Oscillospiraceae bacterium]|nr:hypothetical protein [Oscillospiraceae bacterium]